MDHRKQHLKNLIADVVRAEVNLATIDARAHPPHRRIAKADLEEARARMFEAIDALPLARALDDIERDTTDVLAGLAVLRDCVRKVA